MIDVLDQMEELRTALRAERETLLARLAKVNRALRGDVAVTPGAGRPVRYGQNHGGATRAGAAISFVRANPNTITRAIVEASGISQSELSRFKRAGVLQAVRHDGLLRWSVASQSVNHP